MRPMTPEEAAAMSKAWEEEDARREAFMAQEGWKRDPYSVWYPPDGDAQLMSSDFGQAYANAVCAALRRQGWVDVTERVLIPLLKGDGRDQKWARYRSPASGRVYSYLEAEHCLFDPEVEDEWPDAFCTHTQDLNRLLLPYPRATEVTTIFAVADGQSYFALVEAK